MRNWKKRERDPLELYELSCYVENEDGTIKTWYARGQIDPEMGLHNAYPHATKEEAEEFVKKRNALIMQNPAWQRKNQQDMLFAKGNIQ